MEALRRVLASDTERMVDLRAKLGVGADAIDELGQFFELKVFAGPEEDVVLLQPSQIERAQKEGIYLAVVSNLEGVEATPTVRIIPVPLEQLRMLPTRATRYRGVTTARSRVFHLEPDPSASPEPT
ncbi:MAG TPA: hypothetical protein VK507_05260 [Iamia sp.]|nr:hypothetical protein [Iamia sp.]